MARILVVDDEPSVRQVMKALLNREGHDVVECPDGMTALQSAAKEPPDIILLDWRMPRMDGFEVLSRLRGNPATAAIPVIMVTGHGQAPDEQRALRLGASDFISKPWGQGELEDRVRMALSLSDSSRRPRGTQRRRIDS